MVKYRCYICGKIQSDNNVFPLGIYVPDIKGREEEYQVCEECTEKFKTEVNIAKRKIFEEMVRNNS